MTNANLRGCPMCGTKVSEVDLGLRDYNTWVGDALPGRVAPMDVDFMLEKNGNVLVIEFKPKGVPLPLGQRLTLKNLVRMGMDVWVVWHNAGQDTCEAGVMDRNGNVNFTEAMRVARLRRRVAEWFKQAEES